MQQLTNRLGSWSVAIGKSIEWLCMEDCHSVKLSRLLALSVLILNGSLFRNLTLVSYWASLSVSSALSGSSWVDTPSYRNVLYPAGPCKKPMAIALDRRLVRLSRHLSKNINCSVDQPANRRDLSAQCMLNVLFSQRRSDSRPPLV